MINFCVKNTLQTRNLHKLTNICNKYLNFSVQHRGSDAWRFDFIRAIFDDNTFVDCGSGGHLIDNGDAVLVTCHM